MPEFQVCVKPSMELDIEVDSKEDCRKPINDTMNHSKDFRIDTIYCYEEDEVI